jgi:hypothetical protein
LAHFGGDNQIYKCCEELAELTTELMRHQNGKNNEEYIASEIADCLIMLEQMIYLFHCRKKVWQYVDAKMQRTMAIVNTDKWKGKK